MLVKTLASVEAKLEMGITGVRVGTEAARLVVWESLVLGWGLRRHAW